MFSLICKCKQCGWKQEVEVMFAKLAKLISFQLKYQNGFIIPAKNMLEFDRKIAFKINEAENYIYSSVC